MSEGIRYQFKKWEGGFYVCKNCFHDMRDVFDMCAWQNKMGTDGRTVGKLLMEVS